MDRQQVVKAMSNSPVTGTKGRKGRPRNNNELAIAAYFTRALDSGVTIASAARQYAALLKKQKRGGTAGVGCVLHELEAATLFRRYSEVSKEIGESRARMLRHVQAGGRTSWGAPLRFPEGFMPEARPQRGRPRKKRAN